MLVYLRSNLGNLVSRFDGSLSSGHSSSHHQTGTVGLLALSLKGAQQLLKMGNKQ